MKIALIGPAPPLRGGISQYSSLLASHLDRRHEVLLVSFRRQYPDWLLPGKKQIDPEAEGRELRAEMLLDSTRPPTWWAAARRLAEFGPDVAVLQWWHPFMAPCYSSVLKRLGARARTRVVFLCHNLFSHELDRFPLRPWLERSLVRRLFRRADGFVVHSRALGAAVEELAAGRPVLRAYLPIQDYHFSRYDPGPRPRPPGGPSRLLFFGNVRKYKGLGTLLQAASLLPPDFDYRLTVAGEFYLSEEGFRSQARELGIEERVRWVPRYIRRREVAELFRDSDLLVLPYRHASQSGIVPLAYLFDLPVAATRVGGLPEVVEEGKTGLLVPPGDPPALAEAIARFFREDLHDEFVSGIRSFRERLRWNQVADTILRASKGKQ